MFPAGELSEVDETWGVLISGRKVGMGLNVTTGLYIMIVTLLSIRSGGNCAVGVAVGNVGRDGGNCACVGETCGIWRVVVLDRVENRPIYIMDSKNRIKLFIPKVE